MSSVRRSGAKYIRKYAMIILMFLLFVEVSCQGRRVLSKKMPLKQRDVFPEKFVFAVGSSAYQIEGGWNESDKGESIWDRFTHDNPELIKDHSNGDIACNSFHKFKEDVKMIKMVGFKAYRFSVSWSRVLPTGDPIKINSQGLQYYMALASELCSNSIQPIVTLYHWDLPQRLQDMGGWMTPGIIDLYEEYARIIFAALGDKVKIWITINEPQEVARGYGSKAYAPGINIPGYAEYIAGHNLIRAHAKAYRVYDREFRCKQKGQIGIAINGGFCQPPPNATERDLEAIARYLEFKFGWFASPIFLNGDYPSIMKNVILANSIREGRRRSRLPEFTKEEKREIAGTWDFYAMNYYSGWICSQGNECLDPASYSSDMNVTTRPDPKWPKSQSDWLYYDPVGFRGALNWIRSHYNNPPIFITASGWSDPSPFNDVRRISYFKGYLKELLNAIHLDGVRVMGHTVWTLMDSFVWRQGYTQQFGIFAVDFHSPNRTRTPRKSANFFRRLIGTRVIPS